MSGMAASEGAQRSLRSAGVILGGCVLCAWCWLASGFRHSTDPAFVAWSASLLAVAVIDWSFWSRRRRVRHAGTARDNPAAPSESGTSRALGFAARLRAAALWVALVLVAACWEALGIDTGPKVPHLTISALSEVFRPLDAALMLVWIVVGIGYGWALTRTPDAASRVAEPSEGATDTSWGPSQTAALVAGGKSSALALLLPSNRAAGVAFWLLWIFAFVVADLVARRSRSVLYTSGEIARVISRSRIARIALVAAWTYAGWHLFAH